MKTFFATGLTVLLLGAGAPAALAQTQLEMNESAHDAAMASDEQLNHAYAALTSKLGAKTRALLVKAEQRWIPYRDAECDFEQDKYRGGSLQPTVYWNTYDQASRTRTGQLKAAAPTHADAAADKALNQVYGALAKGMDAMAKELLLNSEQRWLAFRDAEADFEAVRYQVSRAWAVDRLTRTRTAELAAELKIEGENH